MANSARVAVDVGTVIADTYTIEALIGRGGMGSVFLATHKRLPGKQVAIKLLHADLQDPEVILRFKREAEIASRLGHANIVTVHDFNVMADGTPYLVLEFLRGESLAAKLRNGPLPLESVFSIARQVGSALAAAHREGIVHRDLKPQNIFLVPTEVDGKIVEVAKVLDFGISKMRGSTTVKTQEFTLLGTPQYMAPEQAKGDHANVDERTDVFALGAIVYELLAGHPAFSGETIPEVCFKVVYEQPKPLINEAPSAPPSVIEAVTRAMEKASDDRFPSVAAFIEKLTGEKLAPSQPNTSSIPPMDGGAGSGFKVPTGKEAFAQTMHSGDFGIAASTPRPRLPTPIPVVESPPANPQGATMESMAPPSDSLAERAPMAPPKRSLIPVLLIALVSAAVGALVIYLVTRGPSTPTSQPTVAPDAAIVATVTPDAAPVVVPPDAAGVVADAAPVVADAAPVAVDAAVRRTPDARVAPPEPGDDTGTGGADVVQAQRALQARDFDSAERLAGGVIVSPDSGPRQKARARMIRGIVRCVARNNEEAAGLDLKAIPRGFRQLRAALLSSCQAQGYLKEESP
ncbi:MAG: protein kinase [Deltaproteobacteria bacterium]|nr:protein kinase [Deltaproteobacteria bacterium]